MGDKLKILFVCKGNIFRSVTAEYSLRKYLFDNNINDVIVSSAGIEAKKEKINPFLKNSLKKLGILVNNHRQRKITKKILEENDEIIAIGKDHKEFIEKRFGMKVSLFNKFALNKDTPILDIEDCVVDYKHHEDAVEKFIEGTVKHIHTLTPKVYEEVRFRNFLFLDFISGKIKHRGGFPFRPLYESKNSVAFMSIDIPSKGDGHILVVPRRKYVRLEDIPKIELNDLIESVSIVGRTLMESHGGYNLLLNNGESAKQTIQHTHFHIIPRNDRDGIKLEVWKRDKFSKEKFLALNKKYLRYINKIVKD